MSDRIEPGPLPFPDEGEPERGEMWCPGGGKPCGLEFIGCKGTFKCFMVPCPSCCQGWVPVLPDGTWFGYRTAVEAGCSRGCEPELIAWWLAWKMGELPPRPEPDERARRYAIGAVRRILADLPPRPTREQLRSTAYRVGGWIQAASLPVEPVAAAIVKAAGRAGIGDTAMLASALTAGRSRPARLPQ